MKPWPEPWLTAPHFVYEFYAADGACLYVGCTRFLKQRTKQHAKKPWWPEVARTEATVYPTQAEGLAAEADRIRALNPAHNCVLTDHWDTGRSWAGRWVKQDERHDRGELCAPWKGCKRCNEVHRERGMTNFRYPTKNRRSQSTAVPA